MYINVHPLLTVATGFRLQTNVCKRHHRITLCRNPQLFVGLQIPLSYSHGQHICSGYSYPDFAKLHSVLPYKIWQFFYLSSGQIKRTPTVQLLGRIVPAISLILPKGSAFWTSVKGKYPFEIPSLFAGTVRPNEKLSRKLCSLRVLLYTTPPNQSNW